VQAQKILFTNCWSSS